MPTPRRKLLAICIAATFLFFVARGAFAETEIYQRIFPGSTQELERAAQTVQPLTRGRLPILDGFVIPQGQPLDRYSRGYYECTLQVLPSGSDQSIVRAAAKITAWYTDPEASRSGYRVLPSNGRLENDALDRIEEAVVGKSDWSAASSSSGAAKSGPVSPSAGGIQPSLTNSKPLREAAATPAINPASTESVDSIKSRREADEKKAAELAAEAKNLEEILRNQARPTDLVVVKKTAAPIYSKPVESAQVLLTASAHDEFQILGIEGAWVHVQISGASRGWMRRAQLDMPPGYGGVAAQNSPDGATDSAGAIFQIEKEATSLFSGKWEPLQGKNVRVVWVGPSVPANSPSSAKQKKLFAKDVFLKAFAEGKSATPPIEGVVVLFDSVDGGQVAATSASLKLLEDGKLAEAAFWKQCSLDPPELFQDAPRAILQPGSQKN